MPEISQQRQDVGRNFGLTEELKIVTTPLFFTTTGNPHSGGKQDDPAANDPKERDRIIEKLSADLKRGTDPKTGKPYTKKQIQQKRRRLKLLQGQHHRIEGQKGTKGSRPAPKPGQPQKPKPAQPVHPGPEPQHVKPGQPKPTPKPNPPAPPHPNSPRPGSPQQGPHSQGGDQKDTRTEFRAEIADEKLGMDELIEKEGTTFEAADQENEDPREGEAEDVRQDATEEENGEDDGEELTDCVWNADRERTRGAKSFIGKLATDSLDMVGGNGNGTASAYGAPYVRWVAKTDVADSTSALHKIALNRTEQCEDPDPVMELEAISTIKLVDNSASGGLATSAAACVITGDLELTNQGAAASGSAATNTTISLGVLSIQPFTQSDGKVAPPDAIVPKREVKDQADGTMLAATSLAVKANGDAEGAVAESEVTVNLQGHISVRCKNCGASKRIDF